jgi:hypothetical protein
MEVGNLSKAQGTYFDKLKNNKVKTKIFMFNRRLTGLTYIIKLPDFFS